MNEAQTDFANILARMEEGQGNTDDQAQPTPEYDVYVEADRVTFVKKSPGEETSPDEKQPNGRGTNPYVSIVLSLLLLFSSLFIPASTATSTTPSITIFIVPKTMTVIATQAVQLPARVFTPLTLTQTQTAPATGHGHQAATQASGSITFYNGLFHSQTIAAGTILTANNTVAVETSQAAYLPAANPPGLGIATVAAHTVTTGAAGNIPAYAINQTCCATAVKAVNTTAFSSGQDTRNFSIVTRTDIDRVSATLQRTLLQSVRAAFSAQLTATEALIPPTCSESITPDHQTGEAAITVTVQVTERCTAGAYLRAALQEQAQQVLTRAAHKQLGAGYASTGNATVSIRQEGLQQRTGRLLITTTGTWQYQFRNDQINQLKTRLAGKTEAEADTLLLQFPGVQAVHLPGLTTNALLPDSNHIRIQLSYERTEDEYVFDEAYEHIPFTTVASMRYDTHEIAAFRKAAHGTRN